MLKMFCGVSKSWDRIKEVCFVFSTQGTVALIS